MGKASRTKRERVTHEPEIPVNWPDGHVSVDLTDMSDFECIKIVIHGVTHLLHATTARELEKMLSTQLAEFKKRAAQHGIPFE